MIHGNAIGLDYHDATVRICVLSPEGKTLANHNCSNDWMAIRDAAGKHGPVARVGIEACGGAANLAEQLVQRAGWHVDLGHPGYIARMKKTPDKSDKTDAFVIGDLARLGYLPKVWLAPQVVRELRTLVRHRAALVKERTRLKQRIRAVLREQRIKDESGVTAWTVTWMTWLKKAAVSAQGRFVIDADLRLLAFTLKEIAKVEKQLRSASVKDGLVWQLKQEPGIGDVTAWTLRAEIGTFHRFNNGKQLARFCGLSPRNASSGKKQADAGLIQASNENLRSVLIEAAHRLIRCEPRWRELAAKLKAAGKKPCVVVAAIANRWVRSLFTRMKAALPATCTGGAA